MSESNSKMKAAIIDKYGDNGQVHISDVPIPNLGPNDILIEIKAASINPIDTRIREGKLKQILPFKMPLILGNDLAGVVKALGSEVRNFKVGDEVYARTDTMRIGSFAEYISVDKNNVSLKPKNLSMEEAASLPLVTLTSWQILVEKADIQKGQKVLIHGGASGVGSIAVQLAKHLGAYVATTASKAYTIKLKGYGADKIIDYRSEDFSTILKDYDLVLDTRGGEILEKSLQVLKPSGRVISINGTPDANMANNLSLNPLMKFMMGLMSFKINRMAKKLGVTYSFHFMQPSGAELDDLHALVEKNIIRPVVDKVYPLDAVQEALAYSESGKAKGKVIIKI